MQPKNLKLPANAKATEKKIGFISTSAAPAASTNKIFYIGKNSQIQVIYKDLNTSQWQANSYLSSQHQNIDSRCRLCVDANSQNIFAIGKDGKIYQWTPTGAPVVNSITSQNIDPIGGLGTKINNTQNVFSIGTDGKIYRSYRSGSSWIFTALSPTQNKPIDPKGRTLVDKLYSRIFCIGLDGKVYGSYQPNGVGAWVFGPLNPSQFLKIHSEGGLSINKTVDKVFGIGEDGKVYHFSWNGNSWIFSALDPNQSQKMHPSGGVTVDQNADRVFCIGEDGKVYNFYRTNNTWVSGPLTTNQIGSVLNPTVGVKIDPNGKSILDNTTSNVFVIANIYNKEVYSYNWNGNAWIFNYITYNQTWKFSAHGGLVMDGADDIFGIDIAGRVCRFYKTGSTRTMEILVPGQSQPADPLGGLAIFP